MAGSDGEQPERIQRGHPACGQRGLDRRAGFLNEIERTERRLPIPLADGGGMGICRACGSEWRFGESGFGSVVQLQLREEDASGGRETTERVGPV